MGDRTSAESEAPRVAVVGSGAWGTTLAILVARSEPVILLSHSAATAERIAAARENERRLPGVALPDRIQVTADPGTLEVATVLAILAVPSAHLRSTVERVARFVPG
ncbi:MAG TPA: hypothetical protein VF044_03095, partial [Actinomycetota bacterium]